MKCKKCGNKCSDNDKFCKKCGSKLTLDEIKNINNEKIPEKKKVGSRNYKLTIIIITIIAAAISLGIILGGYFIYKNNFLDSIPDKIESYRLQSEKFILTDEETKNFNLLINKLNFSSDNSNISDIKKIYLRIDTLLSEVKERNKNDLKNSLKEFDEIPEEAYESEVNIISSYKKEMENYIKKEKYLEAYEVIEKRSSIIEGINGNCSYNINLEQVDVSEFPLIKLYLRIEDYSSGKSPNNLELEKFYLYEGTDNNRKYLEKEIKKGVQLNELENLNINIVADVSASMDGMPIINAKSVMSNFVNSIQFDIGDKASLITFSDYVYSNISFTSDSSVLINNINNMVTGDMTALYDALYVAVTQTAAENGAKCVIAFTDGMDNASNCTSDIVIELASRYKVPIFIVGVGDMIQESELEYICNNTGGKYWYINDIQSIEDIYKEIYRKQKEMYLIEYTTSNSKEDNISINIDYVDDNIIARDIYEYNPSIYMEPIVSSAQLFTNDFIIFDSDKRFLTAKDLQGLSKDELRLARNEIYARRGRKFNDQALQEYFNYRNWYIPRIEADYFDESIFNDYERANAYFIRDYERLKGFL